MGEDWTTYKLGEILKVKHGFAFKGESFTTEENGNLLLTPGNFGMQGGIKFVWGKQKFYGGPFPKEYILKKGDLLVAMTDLTQSCDILGAPIIIKDNKFNYLHNQRLGLIIGNSSIVSTDYLYHYFNSNGYRSRLIATKSGSTVSHTAPERIYDCEISLPPLPEQRAIASILSALDDKIELNLQMNKTLEDMAMALYKHWFVDFGPFKDDEFVSSELGEIPKGWEVKRLDELIRFSNGYAFKSSQLLDNEEEDCLHVFKMGHIQRGGGLKANGTKSWVRKDECIGMEKYILKIGDILMSMTDMKDNMTILGHTALMNEDNKYIVNQRVGLLRMDNNIGIGYPFIYILTNSFDYIDRLRSQANSGVQVNLSSDAIKSSKVVTPPKKVNESFHSLALPLFEQINQNALENQTLTTLRDTLLPKIISGELRVKDAAKSLAEVL